MKNILGNNVAFMDDCLAKGVISMEALQGFAKKQAPDIKLIINWAASTQVKHWMGVVDGWKTTLGADWDKTYAAANTIYVARQNNVLFSVLAQFFGPRGDQRPADADRDDLVHDHAAGDADVDGPHHLRPLGRRAVLRQRQTDGLRADGRRRRKTIISEMQRRGKQPFLPPAVPFGSKQWPTLVTPGPGPTSLDDLK